MKYQIPKVGELEINTIILDLNGTLSVGGIIVDGVKEKLDKLKKQGFNLVFFTGNTRGDADMIARGLNIDWVLAGDGEAKVEAAQKYDLASTAAIGNGLIDLELMRAVKLRILTLQAEGIHMQTMLESDVVVPTINDALDLFLDQFRLIATVRK